jgi:hypothetical protein
VTGIGGTLLASNSAVAHKHDRKPFHLLVAACALSATGSPSMVAMAPGAIGRHVQRHVSGVCDDAGPQIGYSPVAKLTQSATAPTAAGHQLFSEFGVAG